MSYKPSDEVLGKYANVLVNFALGGGKGIKPGEVVYLQAPLSALPFYRALRKQILDSGGLMIGSLGDDMNGAAKYFYQNANEQQLTAFHKNYYKGLVADVDHRIAVIADHDVHELDKVDPKKIIMVQKSSKPLIKWFNKKENDGRYTWTLALYGTPSMAKEAALPLEQYWQQIIKACYLDYANPIEQWRRLMAEAEKTARKLSNLSIKTLHIKGQDVDLNITLGEKRKWVTIDGRNIPSFEIFTSPDWRGTEGWIRFNQPLYYYGPKVEGIMLHFKNGRIVKSSATKNQKLLHEMLATDRGASQVGEFSLTDKRFSRITKLMAETLYDENIGGPFGNTHLAVGQSYHDTHMGNTANRPTSFFKKLGYNESVIHVDMISTADRTVTAMLPSGKKKIIYQNGQFTI
ncbi:thermophilic metalloprotease (M29) superfamily [Candidatus Saccharibacteria bacterium RIFCSPHIGHO2_01_FULL_48_12]|nr:MAG: thermophilic metalloprotease (M29) superfamily [Candidatus Saccharibacteria bacterium RIFCSPHIGHO2_01_FULL_48_12]